MDAPAPDVPVICCFFDAGLGDQYNTVGCEEEIAALRSLFKPAEEGQHLRLEVLEKASFADLSAVLTKDGAAIRILHYVGTEQTFGRLIAEPYLSTATSNLKLFFYNFCHSQEEAEQLVHNGVPVVIACSAELDIRYSLDFTRQFYAGLLRGASIREAFAAAGGRLEPGRSTPPPSYTEEAAESSTPTTEKTATRGGAEEDFFTEGGAKGKYAEQSKRSESKK